MNPIRLISLTEKLISKQKRDAERQRIGLLGEQYVFEQEKLRLKIAGKKLLASKVKLVSAEQEDAGYDVLSFANDGAEKHIEVKSTSQSPFSGERFWLTENEAQQGLTDP